jgi:rhodanese-related sulfurtransferase
MVLMMKFLPMLVMLVLAGNVNAADNPAVEALQEYLEFAEYGEGAITSAQLDSLGPQELLFIDTRAADDYAAGGIPGAVNIEWREVLSRREEIPMEKSVVLYCDTGLLSSRAQLALKLAGYDNAKVLLGGYQAWQRRQAEKLHAGERK